jgi:hypothetical protein
VSEVTRREHHTVIEKGAVLMSACVISAGLQNPASGMKKLGVVIVMPACAVASTAERRWTGESPTHSELSVMSRASRFVAGSCSAPHR